MVKLELNRYEKQIKRLKNKHFDTSNIEKTVNKAIESIESNQNFVIFGEPQSGKTEMIICLTSKLLDRGKKIIIILLNDSVTLLQQNLSRFSKSGINPAPKNFNEYKDQQYLIQSHECIIFCKKNSSDLKQLIRLLENKRDLIIIDDEADFATPNSKINKNQETPIHSLVSTLESSGHYIGVTATPARLDLNDTFFNNIEKWVYFEPHSNYSGHDTFFPSNKKTTNLRFNLDLIPNHNDSPKFLENAILNFMTTVAYLNTKQENEKNYSILIHTSGKKNDHDKDKKTIDKVIQKIYSQDININKRIKEIATQICNEQESIKIRNYITQNIGKCRFIVLNSDVEKHLQTNNTATHPETPFTIVIGGNIVSRGITFENLLSMFFTRTAKKIQQDTYIQRARMFGNRNTYLKYFTLHVTENLYLEWYNCFLFHRMSLSAIKRGEPPCWIESTSNRAVASASVKKSVVFQSSNGEWYFDLFDFDSNQISKTKKIGKAALKQLYESIRDVGFKRFALDFILDNAENDIDIIIHPTTPIEDRKDKDTDHQNILRKRGLIGGNIVANSEASHHLRVYYNKSRKARLYYRQKNNKLKFLKRKQ